MSYVVLARKWRPKRFAEMVGQEHVLRALANALDSGKVHHAFLFTGTRGVGKTTIARILAKSLNCETAGVSSNPCGTCAACREIDQGRFVDLIEVDAASRTGVDDTREMLDNVQYAPTRGRYKVYLIDEAHMLSKSAFNALLKTLEEPPPHVKFIFATTEVQSIPITILSRCQRFDFGGISIPRILDRLKEIVIAEKMEADEEALETIARRAGGSMRDAQSLLDQLLAFSGQKLTVDTVHQLLGTAHEERVTAIADAVLAKDAKKVLEILTEIVNQGQQLGELLDQLIAYWRDLMVVNSAGIAGQSVSVSSARRNILETHAKQTNLDTILAGMDILVTAKTRMRFSNHPRALIEMALVRLCQLADLVPIGQIAQWLAKEGASPAPRPKSAAPPIAAGNSVEPEKKKVIPDTNGTSERIPLVFQEDSVSEIMQQLISDSGFAIQSELRKINSAAISGPNALVFRVSRRYNTAGSAFSDSARLTKMAETLSAIVARAVKIQVEWIDEPAQTPDAKSAAALAAGTQRQLRAGLLQIPFVKKVAEVLGAQIIRADEGFGVPARPAAAESEETSEGE
jgi:DNA polymerase-3 subunit gamma/tau